MSNITEELDGNITECLDGIDNAVYGKDMKKYIHKGIGICYKDAIANGHTDMEVAKARGKYSDLGSRLDAEKTEEAKERQIAHNNLQSQINVERARINNFTQLNEGSTTGDAELADIRIGHNGIVYNNAGKAVRNQFELVTNDIDTLKKFSIINLDGSTTGKYYDKYFNENTLAYCWQAFINVNVGELYLLSSYAYYSCCRYIVVDESNKVLLCSTETDNNFYEDTKIIVPDGATTLIIQGQGNSVSSIVLKKQVMRNLASVEDVERIYNNNVLFGKKALFVGDSICADSPHDFAGWARRVADNNDMQYKNYGIDGSTITTGLGKNSICSKIDVMYDENPDADYIIIEGGTNDADLIGSILNGNVPDKFGSITTGFNSAFDNTTFCGALESIFNKAVRNWKGKKIGFIVAHKMGGSNTGFYKEGNNRRAYFEKAIEICKKWGIPYINLWDEAYLNPNIIEHYDRNMSIQENEENGKLYRDGQHLTPIAYNYLATKIENWMKTL